MQELKTIKAVNTEVLPARRVSIFFQSEMVVFTGQWQWDLYADSVFCSDVFIDPPPGFEGIRGIIHPDDTGMIRDCMENRQTESLEFRIITSYGVVKQLSGYHLQLEKESGEDIQVQLFHAVASTVENKKIQEHLQLTRDIYERTERFMGTGIWYFNASTNETFFSAHVFRIHGIPAFSLNPHMQTFVPFIHPEEKVQVVEFMDRSFKKRLPLHLEYRIRTPEGDKTVLNVSHWFYSSNGEEILSGFIQDITDQKLTEQRFEDAENTSQFFRQQILFDEQQVGLGHWRINLVTRKVVYSDHCYRIYGLRPQSVPPGTGSFINYIHPEDREAVVSANKKMLNDYAIPDLDYRIIRSDGRIRFVRQRAKLVTSDGEPVMAGSIQDVTALKILENKFEEQTRKVFIDSFTQRHGEEMSGTGSWVWNIHTGRITCSENFSKFVGLSASTMEITQKQLMFHIHPDDQDLFRDHLAMVIDENQSTHFEFRFIHRGVIRKMKAGFQLLEHSGEKFFIGIFQDISREHVMQQQLRQRMQLAEALSENIMDRVMITDVHNMIMLWNRQCEITYKVEKENALGQNFFDIFPQIKTDDEIRLFNSVLGGESITRQGSRSILGTGYYNIHMLPLWNDNMNEVNGIIHIVHDVTKETELRQHLNERLSFIENLVETSVDRIIAMDRNLNYLVWNRKCEEYYGLKKEQVIGRNVLEIFPETQNTPTYEEFRKVLHGETVYIPAAKDSGKENYHEIYLVPVKNDQQEIIAILWILHDLSKEYELRSQQAKTNEIIEALNEGYLELDDEYRFLHVNPITESFWNVNRAELIGKSIYEVFPQTIDSDVLMDMMKSKEEGISKSGEYISPVTGRWIHISFTPLANGIAVFFFDIHENRKAADIIRDGNHLLQKINDATPDAITIYDFIHKEPVYLNHCMSGWIGCTSDELLAMGYEGRLKLIHQDDREILLNANRHLMNALDGDIITSEYRIYTLSGATIWIRNRSKVFKRDQEGKVTHSLSVLQDFTHEVQLRKDLVDRTHFVETMIDASASRIMAFDRDLKVITWNNKCEEEFHIKKEMAIGRNVLDIFPKIKSDRMVMNAIHRSLGGEKVHIPSRKDAYTQNYSELFFIPLRDSLGEVYGVLDMAHDITKRVQDEAELKQLNKILEQRNLELAQKHEEISNFAFIASHDLKEPLRKIHTFSDWLIQNETGQLSTTGRNYLGRMAASVTWMEMLIEDILVLTRINLDHQRTELVNMNLLLARILESINEKIRETGAVIEYDPLPGIMANSHQIFHLFRNLLSNSLKFQEKGNIPLIGIRTDKVQGKDVPVPGARSFEYTRIRIMDNGFGFDNRHAKKIFRVFQRLHSKHEFEGTGIGLAICKRIMENHDGFITADSVPGEGSVFTCYFPVE